MEATINELREELEASKTEHALKEAEKDEIIAGLQEELRNTQITVQSKIEQMKEVSSNYEEIREEYDRTSLELENTQAKNRDLQTRNRQFQQENVRLMLYIQT